jgi:hypothetical protein
MYWSVMVWCRRLTVPVVCGSFLLGAPIWATSTPAWAATPSPVIELPLQVHLIRDMALNRDGVTMNVWITPEDTAASAMPEINRIWRQAGISWRLTGVKETALGDSPVRQDLESFILGIDREPSALRAQWIATLRAAAREAGATRQQFHILVLPYVGRTMQGLALPRLRSSFLGAWTDKPSKGRDAPRRVKLVEPEPLFIGSFARTASHELGHLLGLKHDGCASRCLMGGTRSEGYVLTGQEIETARAAAEKFLAERESRSIGKAGPPPSGLQ